MPDYQIDVGVVPDADRFPEQLASVVGKAEARQDPLEVELSPKVSKGFARDAQRDLKAALAKIDAEVTLSPALAKSFRRDVQKLAQAATKGQAVEVTVTAALPKNFRRDLQRQMREATAGVEPEVTVSGKVAKGFRRDVQRSVNEALAATPITADVVLQVDRRGYAAFVRDVSTRVAEATLAAEVSGAADVYLRADSTGFAAEVLADVGSATRGVSASEAGSVEVRADTTQAKLEIGALSTGLTDLARLAARGLVIGGVAGVAALAATFAGAVGSTADFEQQLSDLTAVASLNAQELGNLREQALKAGADTVFSASEAAEAQTELAKAGASVQQILGGGLPAALSLASAGGIELGQAATFVAQGLNTFQLGAEEAARVSDVLAAAANRSAADIPSLGLGLSQAGLVADSFGISLEQTAGVLALFSQNGLQGSDAGTSFKTMLQRLNPTSEEAAGAIKDLGLEFYDAQGAFVGIESVAGQLQAQLGDLTEEQRNSALQTIFGADAIRAANLLYKEGAPGVREWTGAVTEQGFAAEVAATKLDNLKGDLEALKGSFETAFIEAGSGQTAPLRELVQSLVPIVNDLGPKLAETIRPVTELLTSIAPKVGNFLGSLLPALEAIGDLLVPIVGGLFDVGGAVLDGFLPLLQALEPAADLVADLARAFGPLFDIIGDVGAEVVDVLVDALGSIDVDDVVDSLGLLVEAGGEVLEALVPIIPAAAEIVGIMARDLAPILAEVAPLLTDVLQVLVPVLEQLAHLAPLVVLVLAVQKVAGLFVGLGKSIGDVVGKLKGLETGTFESVNKIRAGLGDKLWSGAVIAAASAASAIAGYMATSSDDAITSLTSIAGAATGVFLAFQQGGPIGAALAAGSFAIGAFFGQAAKRSREAAAEQKVYNEEVLALRDAFDTAGVDQFSSKQGKALVIAQQLNETLRGTDDDAALAKAAFDDLGLSFADVIDAAASGANGIADLNEQIDIASSRQADVISAQSLKGLEDFGALSGVATDSLRDLLDQLDFIDTTEDGAASGALSTTTNLKDFLAVAKDLGLELGTTAEVTKAYQEILQRNIADSPTAQYIASLPQKSRDAILEQTRLAEVQRLVADEQEKQRGSASRFSDAYDEVQGSLTTATTAYTNWLNNLQGTEVPLADVKLGILDYARQLRELASDQDLSPFEKQQKQISLVAQAQGEATAALGQFIDQSGGDFDVFTGKVSGLTDELTTGLAESLGISTDEATLLVAQIVQIPDEKTFRVLAETEDASTGLDDLTAKIQAYVLADVSNTANLETATAAERSRILTGLVQEYAELHPEAVAGLNIDDPVTNAKIVNDILTGLDGRTVSAEVLLGIKLRNEAQNQLNEIKDRQFERFAVGGIVTSPTLALIGEAGDEVVLPLNDTARMLELLTQAGVLGQLAGATAEAAPSAAPRGSGGDAAAVGVVAETSGLEEYADEVAAILAGIGDGYQVFTDQTVALLAEWSATRIPAATIPALTAWQAATLSVAASTTAGLGLTLQAGFDSATLIASAGGSSIVASLVAALSGGTAKIVTVATGYASSLGSSLNPILRAVGQQPLKLARGGEVPGPRVNRDVIPAMLMPGEVVIRKASVDAFGVDNLLALNRGAMPPGWTMPRFADGGEVTGDTVGLNPEFGRRLGLWSAAVGAPYDVGSGFRSMQEQARLYQAYLAGVPGQAPAAPPGKSMHNFGLASDGNRWRDRHPEIFGLRFPMSYEPWHVEPVEARQWAAGVQPDGTMAGAAGLLAGLTPLPQVPPMPYEGAVATAGEAVMRYVYDKALAWAGSQTFGAPGALSLAGGGSAGAASATGWLRMAMALAGVPDSWLPGLLTIARRESNFDPSAVNTWDSNAAKGDPSKGLMQVIGSTFRAFALPGHGNIFNPVDNAVAAIRYILERYGDIANVQQANPNATPRGYADGGLITKDGLYHLAEQNRPELVLPLTKPDRVRQLAQENALERILYGDGGGGSGGGGPTIEGDLIVQVVPPGADDPENYGMALSHRIVPALSAALARL